MGERVLLVFDSFRSQILAMAYAAAAVVGRLDVRSGLAGFQRLNRAATGDP